MMNMIRKGQIKRVKFDFFGSGKINNNLSIGGKDSCLSTAKITIMDATFDYSTGTPTLVSFAALKSQRFASKNYLIRWRSLHF